MLSSRSTSPAPHRAHLYSQSKSVDTYRIRNAMQRASTDETNAGTGLNDPLNASIQSIEPDTIMAGLEESLFLPAFENSKEPTNTKDKSPTPAAIKPDPEDLPLDSWKEMSPNIIALSDCDDDLYLHRNSPFPQSGVHQTIKSEECFETLPFEGWKEMSDSTIVLDREIPDQDDIVLLGKHTEPPIKMELDDGIEWIHTSENTGVIELSDSAEEESTEVAPRRINQPRKQRTAQEIERMRQVQRLYATKALGRPVGASKMFQQPQVQPKAHAHDQLRAQASEPTIDDDGFAWMANTVIPDDDPKAKFKAHKSAYKAKKAARKNTLADDVAFRRAQIEEDDRINRQNEEDASESEAEESDDGLFIPQVAEVPSKRLFPSMDKDDEEILNSLIGKPSSRKKYTVEQKEEQQKKRSRARAYQQEFLKELRANMLAGIEPVLLRDQMRHELKVARAMEAEDAKKKKGRKKTKAADLSSKRAQTGRVSNIGSLVTSNLFEDSNANIDKAALPLISAKKKKEFMTELLASVPLEDQKQANQDRIDIIRASKILGPRQVLPDGAGNWRFKGMNTSLFHYQLQGAAAMKAREQGNRHPHGGILADEMGLGKTIMTIATIIGNRQPVEGEPRCTLIVCPPALIAQWESEFEKHAESTIFKRVKRYHANEKSRGKGAQQEMEDADILLTTYGEVIRSYPKCFLPPDLKTTAEKEAWWKKEWDAGRDLLHRAHFFRVVLDEAQAIKNHVSQTSIACRALMAKHRWALSGTPIQNRLDEFFPYFKFLRIKHTGSFSVFKHNFCMKDNDVCTKRMISIIRGLMIRRSHQDKVLGAPLLILPKNTQATIKIKMSNVEMEIYERVRMRCVRAINAAVKENRLEEKGVIMMFQRLRQMVSHVFMAQEVLTKEFKLFHVEHMQKNMVDENPDVTELERDMVANLKRMVIEEKEGNSEQPLEEEQRLLRDTQDQEVDPKAAKKTKKSTLVPRFQKLLRDLKKKARSKELKARSVCQKCGENAEEPWVTSCYHLYCKECLTSLAWEAADNGLDRAECLKCGHKYQESQPCGGLKELQVHDLSVTIFQDEMKKETVEKREFKLTMKYVDSDDKLLLSTKLIAVKKQLADWIQEDPKRKIIVFTEWHMDMHLLGRVCQQEGWKSCQYNGRMSQEKRNNTLEQFQNEDSSLQIMVASLKCGGTGLNLTAASKVICVDLWYNSYVEQQAFARVHRIGQKNETYITRFVIEDTVDERLIAMQEEKKGIIGAAMDDRAILSQLTLPELLKLFGEVAYDENSKAFILVEDELDVVTKGSKKSGGAAGGDGDAASA